MTNLERRGVENPSQDPSVREKQKATNLERRGVEYPGQCPIVKEKIKQTNLRIRGVENPSQCPEIKEKKRITNLSRFGVECVFQNITIQEKIKKTLLDCYGIDNPGKSKEFIQKALNTMFKKYGSHSSQNSSVKAKTKETNRKRYGVDYPLQNPIIFHKSQFKWKKFIFPSGKIVSYQGYEHFALRDLVKDGFNEKQILNFRFDMPLIYYTYKNSESRYFPDIYIPSIKKLIEVKSQYTFDKYKDINIIKMKKCIEMGFDYELRIYDAKGKYFLYKLE